MIEVICQHLSENHFLSDKQFAFRPSCSTSDLLLIFSNDWQDALDIFVVALDIAGAFDRVWHKKLCTKGIQCDLLVLLQDYLQGRTLQVVINGQSSRPFPIQALVPQGSVLGPILWNISIDGFLLDSQRAVRELNRQLRLVEEWGRVWQVNFALEKSCLRTSVLWGQMFAARGAHQGPGNGHGPLPAFRSPCCCRCSTLFNKVEAPQI